MTLNFFQNSDSNISLHCHLNAIKFFRGKMFNETVESRSKFKNIKDLKYVDILFDTFISQSKFYFIELLKNNSHGLSPSGGLVSPSGGFVSLLCDQPGPSNGILH